MQGISKVILVASMLAAPVLAAKPSSGCGKTPTLVSSASSPLSMTVNNKKRDYFIKVPDNYDKDHPYRLVFTLHALGGNAGQVVAGTGGYLPYYGLPPLINDTVGALYIVPNGLNNGWGNAGGEDITFIQNLIKTIEAEYCIDQNLRFSTGFSYGAAMSYSIACTLGKDFRAVAALSGGPISGCVGGNDPVAYYGQHGIKDQMLPISMGRQMRDRFVKNNGCTAQTPPEPASGSGQHIKTTYSGCKEGYPVVFVAFDGDHTPQPKDKGASTTFSAVETWDFFKQFT